VEKLSAQNEAMGKCLQGQRTKEVQEEAAVRLERMSDTAALEILRLVKPKTAGAILGQVKADRAAKLTDQLLAQTHQ